MSRTLRTTDGQVDKNSRRLGPDVLHYLFDTTTFRAITRRRRFPRAGRDDEPSWLKASRADRCEVVFAEVEIDVNSDAAPIRQSTCHSAKG